MSKSIYFYKEILYGACVKRSELILNIFIIPIDYLMLLLAGVAAYFIRVNFLDAFREVKFTNNLPFEKYIVFVAFSAVFFIIFFGLSGLYNLRTTRKFFDEISKIFIASSAGLMAVIVYIFLRAELFDSRFLVLGAWLLGILFVISGRLSIRKLQKFLSSKYGVGIHKVLVIGEDELSRSLVDQMKNDRDSGYVVVKQLSHPAIDEVARAIGNPGIDEVVLANPNYPPDEVIKLVEFCGENHIGFRFVPNLYQTLTKNFYLDTFINVPFVELRRTALDEWGSVYKRAMDIVGSVFGIILLSPVFAAIAFAIKWETEGPVFIRLTRVSMNKKFGLIKFRSMIKDAEQLRHLLADFNERKGTPFFKMRNDPRVTKVGKFLRKYRFDELPQLWNVLVGDISLVGPRPHEPEEIEKYESRHRRVFAIKSGITGLAQVSGSSDLSFEKEVSFDMLYIESWSLWMDIKILAMTFLKFARDRSAV